MRIGLFADMYQPHVSGITNHIRLCKAAFERAGHEAFVLTFGDTDFADAEEGVVRSPGLPWGSTGWQLAGGYTREARAVVASLDVAHVHHPFQSGRLAAPLARAAGIPLVFTNHTRYDLYSDTYAGFVPAAARHAFVRRALHAFTRECDLVVAPAPSIAEWLERFADVTGARVIPNGIDVDAFAHPTAPVPRAELGFSPDDVVLAYAGRIAAEKRSLQLAEEFARAAALDPRLRLLLLGDGPGRSEAEQALVAAGVSDRATFVGMLPYERVPDFEAAADAFVTASVSEVHPLVVLEAMAAGLPVIALASPGIADTVVDGESGLLGEAGIEGELAQRMERLARDAELRARLSAGARSAANRYSIGRTAGALLAAYGELGAR